MIRPVDMQVNFNAIPEFARDVSAAQAGEVYRQVKDLVAAKQENLQRPGQVRETNEKEAVENPRINPKIDEHKGSGGRGAGRGRGQERKEERLYAPGGRSLFRRARYEEAAGLNLDLIA